VQSGVQEVEQERIAVRKEFAYHARIIVSTPPSLGSHPNRRMK